VANAGSDNVWVRLGNGDGSFATYTRYPAGDTLYSVAIGDFNGDGKQDLATANFFSDDVSVLIGNGDGSFIAQTRYSAGEGPRSVAIGDFNGDGRQDLATANWRSDDVSVLLGNGDGSFATETRYQAGNVPTSVAIGDFDNDGRQDLAVTNGYVYEISVLLGNGDGSFAMRASYPAGDGPHSIAIGDFDNDGGQDLAVANYRSHDVPVLLNHMIFEIDINPGVFPNTINTRLNYVVSVALLGSEVFDVADVDVTSLRFGPDEASPAHDLTDTWTYTAHLQDVNFDGFMDLIMHFPMQDTGIACGDESATLTGNMLSGKPIEGTDSIRTVGCGGRRNVQSIFERQQLLPSRKTDRPVDFSSEEEE